MKIKITLRNKKVIIVPINAVNKEGVMEELAGVISEVFGLKTQYITKRGVFVDIYGTYIRYSEIDVIEEVVAQSE